MEIRWFKGTDCIYLYKNGEVTKGRGYEFRVSVDGHQLRNGDVSLILRKIQETDVGHYTCQVISEEVEAVGRVRLFCRKSSGFNEHRSRHTVQRL